METIYEQFIGYLKECQNQNVITDKASWKKYEKHRILAGHAGGTYAPNNVVLCTYENHRLAHYYRYLAYRELGDYIAWNLMRGMEAEGRRAMAAYAGTIGGAVSSTLNKEKCALFFSPEWQKLHAYRGAGKRNVESGHLARLNVEIDLNRPDIRSKAGHLGGKAATEKQRKKKTAFFNSDTLIQRKGNLVRWGAKIDGIRVPYNKLSPEFIQNYLFGPQTKSKKNF